jgi:hypothetical protein
LGFKLVLAGWEPAVLSSGAPHHPGPTFGTGGWRLGYGTGEWELTLGSRWPFTLVVALGSFFTLTKRIIDFLKKDFEIRYIFPSSIIIL